MRTATYKIAADMTREELVAELTSKYGYPENDEVLLTSSVDFLQKLVICGRHGFLR